MDRNNLYQRQTFAYHLGNPGESLKYVPLTKSKYRRIGNCGPTKKLPKK